MPEPEEIIKKSKWRIYFESLFRRSDVLRTISLFLTSLVISFVLFPHLLLPPKRYQLGDIAQSDIKAKRDFLVEDVATTQRYRQKAMEEVPLVYSFDEKIWQILKDNIKNAFEQTRKLLEENRLRHLAQSAVKTIKKEAIPPPMIPEKSIKETFEKLIGVKLKKREFVILKENGFSTQLEDILCELLEPVFKRGIINNKIALQAFPHGVLLVFSETKKEQRVYSPQRFLNLEEAKQEVTAMKYNFYGKIDRKVINTLVKIALSLIRPNVHYDPLKTQMRKEKAAEAVKPVFYQVKRGEMIVREGEKIDQLTLLKLKAQEKQVSLKRSLFLFICMTTLVFLFLWTTKGVLQRLQKNFLSSNQGFFFWLSNITFFFLICRAGWEINNLFAEHFSFHGLDYALPAAGATMLAVLFVPSQAGMVIGGIMAALMGFMLKKPLFFWYFLAGSWWVAFKLKDCRHRMKLIKTGLQLGILQMAMAITISAVEREIGIFPYFINACFAGLGGIMVGMIVLGLTPLVEIIFGYTSDIRLLELASLDQPLLKELMVKAPGTYLHSIITSQMAEAAAEEIGANPLLAKVASYYHDIGKLNKPLYFIENQIGVSNRHERLSPLKSALIIMSHVKEGVQLAKQYHLGNEIIDIIKQHHGTSLVTYFYHKAKEQNLGIKEEDFRYPGPKPQTKEAGLVMLADAVEAACRSLNEPTPSKIEQTIQKIISNIFLDGQLDECELTLKEMHKIAERFSKVLIGISHPRIEYPEIQKEETDENLDKFTKGSPQGFEKNQIKSKDITRRFGLIKK
ncbi:MAG TPA: HDIG domain-containing protein [Candidatus Desulfofervidus auxilii]|uniref:HDIG domain-containing protein n=1 Tax=Desulfofervidus auxilii TaxID=1621989 RepID=A0A7V0I9U8_DESA2|nr:HDIG domain-containing protein [Candidatus Desulfofervidus auxilii]